MTISQRLDTIEANLDEIERRLTRYEETLSETAPPEIWLNRLCGPDAGGPFQFAFDYTNRSCWRSDPATNDLWETFGESESASDDTTRFLTHKEALEFLSQAAAITGFSEYAWDCTAPYPIKSVTIF